MMEFLEKYYKDKDFGKVVMAIWAIALINAFLTAFALGSTATMNPMALASGMGAFGIAALLGLVGTILYIYLGYVMGKAKKWDYSKVAVEEAIVGAIAGVLSGIVLLVLGAALGGMVGLLGGVGAVVGGIIWGAVGGAILGLIGRLIASLL